MTTGVQGAMTEQQFQRVAKALADARRFAIYERIAATPELACQRMSECFPVSQATVSHHLKELAGAGLVESRREGQYVFYRALPETLDAYLAELRRRIPATPGPAERMAARKPVARERASA
jgi:ArsR family transcriptional regulator